MPSKEGPYANVVNVVVSNTGATTVPSGWLLSVTPQSGAPYVQIDQSWEEKPTLFHGSLAMFGNLVRLLRSARTQRIPSLLHDLVRLFPLFSFIFDFFLYFFFNFIYFFSKLFLPLFYMFQVSSISPTFFLGFSACFFHFHLG